MRWLITGAGAVGAYFGSRLIEGGQDVAFLVRPGRLKRMQKFGLQICSPFGDIALARPVCVTKDGIQGPFDVVMVACKAYQLEEVIHDIEMAVGPGTIILPLLNGMTHLERLGEAFGADRVLGGMCVISVGLEADGAIHHYNRQHMLVYGEIGGRHSSRISQLKSAFEACEFDSRASSYILQEMWDKWVLIACLASVTCLLRAPVGDIVKAGADDIALRVLDECTVIARDNGFTTSREMVESIKTMITEADSTVTASMFKDIERRAPIEAQQILGELLACSRRSTAEPTVLRIAYKHLCVYEARREREVIAGVK